MYLVPTLISTIMNGFSPQSLDKSLSEALPSFLCPLSLDVMEDPVVLLRSSQTFERKGIEKWLQSHDSCPISRTALNGNHTLVPNIALRNAIDEWRGRTNTVLCALKYYAEELSSRTVTTEDIKTTPSAENTSVTDELLKANQMLLLALLAQSRQSSSNSAVVNSVGGSHLTGTSSTSQQHSCTQPQPPIYQQQMQPASYYAQQNTVQPNQVGYPPIASNQSIHQPGQNYSSLHSSTQAPRLTRRPLTSKCNRLLIMRTILPFNQQCSSFTLLPRWHQIRATINHDSCSSLRSSQRPGSYI